SVPMEMISAFMRQALPGTGVCGRRVMLPSPRGLHQRSRVRDGLAAPTPSGARTSGPGRLLTAAAFRYDGNGPAGSGRGAGGISSMAVTCDFLIVGGGVIGTSVALALARRRAGRVVLLEKSFLGAGSSGKSGAII